MARFTEVEIDKYIEEPLAEMEVDTPFQKVAKNIVYEPISEEIKTGLLQTLLPRERFRSYWYLVPDLVLDKRRIYSYEMFRDIY